MRTKLPIDDELLGKGLGVGKARRWADRRPRLRPRPDAATRPLTHDRAGRNLRVGGAFQTLFGRGCGFVGIGLLASALMVYHTLIWTMDQRLAAVATELGRAYRPALAA